MSSSMPKLPARKAHGSSKPAGPLSPAAGLHEAMLSQVSNLSSNPGVMRLMQSPELLEAVKERDPTLKRLLEQNPAMSELLAPENLRSVMELVKDPARILSQGATMFGGMDLSEQRQAVTQLESYSRDLQSRVQQQQQQQQGQGQAEGQQPQQQSLQAQADGAGAGAALLQMRARMQQLQQHLAAQAAGSSSSSSAAAAAGGGGGAAAPRPWAAGMAPPHQSPAFFKPPSVVGPSPSGAAVQQVGSGRVRSGQEAAAGDRGDGGEQGGYSFTHSEREITLDELPYEAQQKLLAAYGIKPDDIAPVSASGPGPGPGEPMRPPGPSLVAGGGGGGDGGGDGGNSGGGGGVRQVALPSFSTWQQEQLAAAARAAQALPPSAWPSLMQTATHGSALPQMTQGSALPMPLGSPLPMSTPSRDEATAGGADTGPAGVALGGPWLAQGPGHSHHSHSHHGLGHGLGHGHFPGLQPHGGNHQHQGHHHQHHHQQGGGQGQPCCSGHDHNHNHGHQHQHMYGSEYDQYGSQFGMYGFDAGPARKVRPRDYYEPVEPNLSWRGPEGQEGCGSLYRRAYHSYCDMLFFPPLFALTALLLVAAPGLPFWLLVGGLVAAALPGTYCFVVVLAGLPRDKMATSRNFLSLIATCEVVYPLVYGLRVLPYWHGLTSTASLLLLAGFIAMPLLHLHAVTADPGYVPRQRDLQQVRSTEAPGESQLHDELQEEGELGQQRQRNPGGLEDIQQQQQRQQRQEQRQADGQGPVVTAGAAAAAAGLGLGMLAAGLTAPLPEEDGGGGGGGAKAAADWAERQCGTCLVARPLRAKHCQFCNRCVRRFDHHCPAIANCVGEANERSFAAWLFTMWVTQILVVYVAVSFMMQRHLAATGQTAASSAPDTGPAAVWAALRWAAAGHERGLLLMAGLQALCFIPGSYLAARQAFCILANLTANELINQHRYNYLQDDRGGYCNRFDRGVALNCFSFWLERNSNWRAQYDAGEREMCRRGARRLSFWSVGWWLMTWQEDYAARRDALREAVVDLRKEKARRGAAVRAEAAAAMQATAAAAAAAKKT
ncbi:hypothetical protein PLESTB_001684100 [Pleodorina starrii]|uniref:protein S-acyltransferase n=1 Tax=Pleodorina starrii TaxID=330485 RepID=A0A9W6BZA5_9CHLO|nr:hypothetical protein PLESTB_001684100 [Pleodorina starrii]